MTFAHWALSAIPLRCSLPSRLPPVVPSAAAVSIAGDVLCRRAVLLGGVGDAEQADRKTSIVA